MEVYYSDTCPKCGKKNFTAYGDPSDLTVPDIEGLRCWNCKHEWIFFDIEQLLDPKRPYYVNGLKELK